MKAILILCGRKVEKKEIDVKVEKIDNMLFRPEHPQLSNL